MDKYIGDAIVALYNVPVPIADYQFYACNSALEIVAQAKAMRREYAEHPIFLHSISV